MIRLVIAEDQAFVRGGLKKLFALVPDFEVVGEAVNGGEVLECLRQAPFDVPLLNLNMPGISGANLILRVKGYLPNLTILVLSMHNEPQVATRVLKAGATGYITKDCESGDSDGSHPQGRSQGPLHCPGDRRQNNI
jgi:DNA-binding NarL/FixJ family response regulator